jgi:hypothetical protein
MPDSQLNLFINAQSNASAVLGGITGSVVGGIAQAALLGVAIGSVVAITHTLASSFTDAVDISSKNISLAGTFMALTGESYKQSTAFVDGLTDSLAKVASALPGATQSYVKITTSLTDDLIPAFKDFNGVLDETALKQSLLTIGTGAGFLASQSKTDEGQTSLAISRALQGGSESQLRRLAFFQNNPAVLALMKEEAAKLGVELGNTTGQQSAEIVAAAFKRAVPPEVIEASKKSIAGLTESLASSLFDPNVGFFGLLRDLDPKVEGNQTALVSIGLSLDSFVGENGLFTSIKNLMSALGYDLVDPMQIISDGAVALSVWVNRLSKVFSTLSDGLNTGSITSPDWESFRLKVGEFGTDMIVGIINSIPNVINFVTSSTNSLVRAAAIALASLDWARIGASIGDAILNVNFVEAIGFIGVIVGGFLISALPGIISGLIVSAVTALGAALIGPLFASAALVVGSVALGLVGLVALIGIIIYQNRDAINAALKNFSDAGNAIIANIFSNISSHLSDAATLVTQGFNLVLSGITDFFRGFVDSIKNAGNMAKNFILGPSTPTPTNTSITPTTIKDFILGPSTPAAPATAMYGPTLEQLTGADGYIPNYGNGFIGNLLRGAISEGLRMPSGAGIAIANTSEAILNQSQQGALGRVLGSRSGGGITIGDIHVNSNASDPQAVAQEVIQRIEAMINQRMQSTLSPNF